MSFIIKDNVLEKYTGKDKNVVISDDITEIKRYAFYSSQIENVVMPDSVIKVREAIFSKCSALETVALSKNLNKISGWMFDGCESLSYVVIPDSVKTIDYAAFNDCSSLQSIHLSKNLVSIDPWTFNGCSSLKNITIPDGITLISGGVFYGCTSLKNITIPDSVIFIDSTAFVGCPNLIIKCNPGSYAEQWAEENKCKTAPIMSQMRLLLNETVDISAATDCEITAR